MLSPFQRLATYVHLNGLHGLSIYFLEAVSAANDDISILYCDEFYKAELKPIADQLAETDDDDYDKLIAVDDFNIKTVNLALCSNKKSTNPYMIEAQKAVDYFLEQHRFNPIKFRKIAFEYLFNNKNNSASGMNDFLIDNNLYVVDCDFNSTCNMILDNCDNIKKLLTHINNMNNDN
ncbi:AC63 [Trabala vishnou gigantina nucleopolyhedrovirus]|uniref:AC63 n=1 Tax=Trabala vishnou gigantina nucleopolyhedrovirus TaxID=2863583 RepID=UPI002481E3A3|nr:AC63 [Trabala vishnou gigantina nucleopolyhedrovirus]QYC92746.1 AC63 [Trabala vishnou gigantina nucleopolyhedrovirus]